ncbi:MAG: D-alanine--D-alanine ligase [Flavobacteriales bacterium]|nr:D-alanine--D-alanine ligase [Flavobacteriales bacterium]
MNRPLIAILRGGYTGESVISMQSARTMMEAVDLQRYEALYVSVSKGKWTCERADESPVRFDRGQFTAERGHEQERFAAALIAIHGSPGEDGRMQGYLDMLGVPYATGGVRTMAIAMSKFSTTGLLRQMGFPVAPSIVLRGRDPHTSERVLAEVGLPCFVKPDGSGSSLGISRANTPEELEAALELAFAEDDTVMCEALVTGRELTCGVIRLHGQVQAMPVCEIRTSRPFFDYEAKYHSADTQELIPAPIPDDVTKTVQERSVAIYKALGCDGMVRIDHFWTGKEVITIEANTTPGFSGASIFPKMLAVAGIGVRAAINGLIEGCLQRAAAK